MSQLDPRRRFTGLAEVYARVRPSYPEALFAWLEREAGLRPGAAVVDLGCGTGISTRLWAARGYAVTGVDPNDDMLASARREGGAEYVKGEASATGLPSGRFALASAAQAFHWFPIPETLRELRRVLAPGGRCAAFWNARKATPLLEEYEALLRRHSSEYGTLGTGWKTIDALKAAGARDAREAEFSNAQELDREDFFGRVSSSSYVAHGVADKAAFERELGALFDRHQSGGRVRFDYAARVLLFLP